MVLDVSVLIVLYFVQVSTLYRFIQVPGNSKNSPKTLLRLISFLKKHWHELTSTYLKACCMHKHDDRLTLWLIKASGLVNHLIISYFSKSQTLILERKAEATSFCLFPNQPEQRPIISAFQAGKIDETGRVWSSIREGRESDFVRQAHGDDAIQRYREAHKMGCCVL